MFSRNERIVIFNQIKIYFTIYHKMVSAVILMSWIPNPANIVQQI